MRTRRTQPTRITRKLEHTAYHEAGLAVLARLLAMLAGEVSYAELQRAHGRLLIIKFGSYKLADIHRSWSGLR